VPETAVVDSAIPPPGDAWQRPASVPLDRDGPLDIPFEPPPPILPERPIFEWFDAWARRDPAATALIDRAVRLSYNQLRRRALNLAHQITAIVPRDRAVGIWLRADAQLPLAILACPAAGRTALVLNHRNRRAGLHPSSRRRDPPQSSTPIPGGTGNVFPMACKASLSEAQLNAAMRQPGTRAARRVRTTRR